MQEIKVSVIVPVYNKGNYMNDCITSLLRQTYSNFELILIDDGSTDNSLELCQMFKESDSRVSVYTQQNGGAASARNAGLAKARGEYVYFCDADDVVELNLLSDNIELANESGADITVFGNFKETVSNNDTVVAVRTCLPGIDGYCEYDKFKTHFLDYFKLDPYSVCNKIYRTNTLRRTKAEFPNQKVGEDALFNLSLYSNPISFAFNAKPYYHYRMRNGSTMKSFYPKRFEFEFAVAQGVDELISLWGLTSKYNDLIQKNYVRVLEEELNNVSCKHAPMTYTQKVVRLRELASVKEISHALLLVSYNGYSCITKVKVFLLKHGCYHIAILIKRLKH